MISDILPAIIGALWDTFKVLGLATACLVLIAINAFIIAALIEWWRE